MSKKIAIAAGKGGTGKTTVAVNLAVTLDEQAVLADCDVEEPNCHIFLRPDIESTEAVSIPVPRVDEERCTDCGECGRICQFSAIVSLKSKPLTFPELCHGCGGCSKVCPEQAIREQPRELGVVETARRGSLRVVQGRLQVGRAICVPVINAVIRTAAAINTNGGMSIYDCPPGTSCPVIAAVRGADYVVLVTEPTPFGLHDLDLAVQTVRQLGIPLGVVINRSDIGDGRVDDYCLKQKIDVLMRIPDDRRIAEAYSRGEIAVEVIPEYRNRFEALFRNIEMAKSPPGCGGISAASDARRMTHDP